MTKLLTVADVGKIMGVSRPTAYRLVNQAGFPKIQVGRAIRIPEAAFEKWVEQQAEVKS